MISLRADNADLAIARITDLMCESLLGYKGQRAYRAGENEQEKSHEHARHSFVLLLGGPEQNVQQLDSRAELTGDEISAIQKLAADSSRTDI